MDSTASSGHVLVSENPDVRIFYETSSTQIDRPVIVLSHSLSAATWLWDSFVDELSSQFTIVCYDIRFHGRSPLSTTGGFDYNAGHTIEDLASDVIKLLDHLKIQQAEAFIGLSIGGGIAVVLAAKQPNRFRQVLAVGSRATAAKDDGEVWAQRVQLAHDQGMPTLAKQSVERWFKPEWRAANASLVSSITERVGHQSLDGYLANIAALQKLNLFPHADSIKSHGDGVKILFVVGENDATPVVEETKAMAVRSGSQVVIVKEAGHITHIEQPEAFFALVKRTLNS